MPSSPRTTIGRGPAGEATEVRTDADGHMIVAAIEADAVADGTLFYISDAATIGVARTYLVAVGNEQVDMWICG